MTDNIAHTDSFTPPPGLLAGSGFQFEVDEFSDIGEIWGIFGAKDDAFADKDDPFNAFLSEKGMLAPEPVIRPSVGLTMEELGARVREKTLALEKQSRSTGRHALSMHAKARVQKKTIPATGSLFGDDSSDDLRSVPLAPTASKSLRGPRFPDPSLWKKEEEPRPVKKSKSKKEARASFAPVGNAKPLSPPKRVSAKETARPDTPLVVETASLFGEMEEPSVSACAKSVGIKPRGSVGLPEDRLACDATDAAAVDVPEAVIEASAPLVVEIVKEVEPSTASALTSVDDEAEPSDASCDVAVSVPIEVVGKESDSPNTSIETPGVAEEGLSENLVVLHKEETPPAPSVKHENDRVVEGPSSDCTQALDAPVVETETIVVTPAPVSRPLSSRSRVSRTQPVASVEQRPGYPKKRTDVGTIVDRQSDARDKAVTVTDTQSSPRYSPFEIHDTIKPSGGKKPSAEDSDLVNFFLDSGEWWED